MKYAILLRESGHLVDYCNNVEEAKWFTDQPERFELVDTTNSSKIEVIYTELGGPNGYGHQEPSFVTYGGILLCIKRLGRWMQDTSRIFGPNYRDIRDYFKHCRLYVNKEDKSEWLFNQISNLDNKTIYA